MPIVLLIRHGENDYVKKGRLAGRLPGVHLNENGRKQAQAVADYLAGTTVKAIYSSPLERAMETAEPIAHALNLEIVQRPGLMETDCGEWQNQSLKGLRRTKLWKVVQSAPSRFRFPGGEAFSQAQLRIAQELETLACQHDEKDIFVCVSHADPIRLAVAYFIGLPLDAFQRLYVGTASITTLALDEGSSHLVALNYEISFSLPKA